jgi:hypothetical protein
VAAIRGSDNQNADQDQKYAWHRKTKRVRDVPPVFFPMLFPPPLHVSENLKPVSLSQPPIPKCIAHGLGVLKIEPVKVRENRANKTHYDDHGSQSIQWHVKSERTCHIAQVHQQECCYAGGTNDYPK